MSSERTSRIRQRVYHLLKEKAAIVWNLLETKAIVMGSFYKVFRTCNYANCRCRKGKKHGPFWALSFSKDGKRGLKMVKAADVERVQEKALAYKCFQKGLADIHKLNKELDDLLEEVKQNSLEEYP